MLALTIIQPWAYSILHLGKRIENRTWGPATVVGKRILLHAGLNKHEEDYLDAQLCIHEICGVMPPDSEEMDRGCIVGAATVCGMYLQGFTTGDPEIDKWRCPDQIAWVLSDVVALEQPIACKGNRLLWHVPKGVADEIRKRFSGS